MAQEPDVFNKTMASLDENYVIKTMLLLEWPMVNMSPEVEQFLSRYND
jgi:hypothetical protein